MNKFSWYEAKSVEDALSQANTTLSEELFKPSDQAAIFKSGGIDILDFLKEGLISPKTIINIREIPGLDKISHEHGVGMTIGANVTLADIEHDGEIQKNYPALYQAVAHAATPQLRNMSTLGGNIAQRNRCWYFRSVEHPCFRKNGDRCFARHSQTGQNEGHAIIDNGSCVSVHASSISTALLALQAKVVIVNDKMEKKEVPIEDFFVSPAQDVSRENILQKKDLITGIKIPTPTANTKSYYIKQVARESYDWSLADVAVVAEMKGNTCQSITIALGAAAPTPIRSYEAEALLKGKQLSDQNIMKAAEKAMEVARPLSKNGYKVPLFKSIISRALKGLA
ncbi:MAG: xanthine dehydrogenase family protein subunit M [Saprospiraceae bacterium]|nr:xanthine dehydrogenase family protein subunit M [Saprospiraceae bacterium]